MTLTKSTRKVVPSPRLPRHLEAFDEAVAKLSLLTNWEQSDRRRMLQEWSLEPMLDLMARLNNPHRRFKVVHVAGTKGKGSVCSLIEQGLLASGIAAARYASPHVECLTERISVVGRPISKARFAELIETVLAVCQDAAHADTPARNATTFDILTACAFLEFGEGQVEWAVLECGLGGRLDSTNVVDGKIAVITNIDLEHVEVLGRTKAAIAKEKAGIIKSGCAVVTGVERGDQAWSPIVGACNEKACSLMAVEQGGTMNDANVRLACAVLDEVFRLDGGSSRKRNGVLAADVISRSRLPGRMERVSICSRSSGNVPIVLDGAHVPSSLARVFEDLDDMFEGRPCVAVLGLGADKDATGMVLQLSGRVEQLITTQVSDAALDRFELRDTAAKMGLRAISAGSPLKALVMAAEAAGPEGWVLVTGSLHLVGALRLHTRPDEQMRGCVQET